MNRFSIATLGLLMMCASAALQAAAQYRVTDLGSLPGITNSFAHAINDFGLITGESGLKPFVWSNGAMSPLPAPPGSSDFGIGLAINREGSVAGYTLRQLGGASVPVVWNGAAPSVLNESQGPAGYRPVSVSGINGSGLVVGYEVVQQASTLTFRPIVFENGQRQELAVSPGATSGVALAVADSGYIAGSDNTGPLLWRDAQSLPVILDADGYGADARAVNERGAVAGAAAGNFGGRDEIRAAVWDETGHFSVIDPLPGFTKTFALGLNDALQVVGGGVSDAVDTLPRLPNPSYDQRAFFWEGGIVYDLNTLLLPGSGWHLAQARDINNRGEIVGVGFNANGDLRGFLLSPVPEPDRYALWAVGLGVVLNGLARRARRKAK